MLSHHVNKLNWIELAIFFKPQQPQGGQDFHIIEASQSHSDTPHAVRLFWTGDQPDAETSI